MRKMVIHFGPDSEGSGAQKHDIRDTDPAAKRYTQQPEAKEDLSWRSLLSRNLADKIRKAERLIDGVAMGIGLLKNVKRMNRRKKLIAGAVVVAGVAGATYLRMRTKRR